MSESRLRRIEEKLNALIPKAVWLLSNYNSVVTGPCAPCPPCVAGETPAAAETVPAESVATFTPLDPEVWPFHDDETPKSFKEKLKKPEYIHFFTSLGFENLLNLARITPTMTASILRGIMSTRSKNFKTLPENQAIGGKLQTAKQTLLYYTPETYLQKLKKVSGNTLDENLFVRINNFITKLVTENDVYYKPFQEMNKKVFADLYAVFLNLYQSLQAGGCNTNKTIQKHLNDKQINDAKEDTKKITDDARHYLNVQNSRYQRRLRQRQAGNFTAQLEDAPYVPFENFDEWNWVENDLKAAEAYYAQSERENSDLYPFSTFEEWKHEFDSRTGGVMTTRAESLAAAKHYREGGSINETYPQGTLKEWNDARIAAEGPRVILPSKEMPQTPDWCFVALTSLFTQHPYVVNYFQDNRTPNEIPAQVSQRLIKLKDNPNPEVAKNATSELLGKVIFSVLLNFVTTYEPLQANLASILAGEITDPSSYNLFAAYLDQTQLPETAPENMAPPQEQTQTVPTSETLPETIAPKLNSLQRMQLREEQEKTRQQEAIKKLATAARLKVAPIVADEITDPSAAKKPVTSIFEEIRNRGQTQPAIEANARRDAKISKYGGYAGGLRKHGRKNKSHRRKSTRRPYANSPLHPFY